MIQKVYLDTSIFIAEFDKKEDKHKILGKFLKEIAKVEGVDFYYSKWALTEMYNKLTKQKIEELKIVKYINGILNLNKLRCLRLKSIDVSPNNSYNFNDFFNDLSKDLIRYKTGKGPSVGDIIHVRIMKNNKINTILTFDSDFESIPGFQVINLLKIDNDEKEETSYWR